MVTVNEAISKLESDLYGLSGPAWLTDEKIDEYVGRFKRIKNVAIKYWKNTSYYIGLHGVIPDDEIYERLDKYFPKKFVEYMNKLRDERDYAVFNRYRKELVRIANAYKLTNDVEMDEECSTVIILPPPPPPGPRVVVNPVNGQPGVVVGPVWIPFP